MEKRGGRGVQKEREACLSDARRGHETQRLGTRLAKQGTRASSSDSMAGSELHGCLPLGQVSTHETPQSLVQAAAGPEVGPLEALWGHTIPSLAGRFQKQPRMDGQRQRWVRLRPSWHPWALSGLRGSEGGDPELTVPQSTLLPHGPHTLSSNLAISVNPPSNLRRGASVSSIRGTKKLSNLHSHTAEKQLVSSNPDQWCQAPEPPVKPQGRGVDSCSGG